MERQHYQKLRLGGFQLLVILIVNESPSLGSPSNSILNTESAIQTSSHRSPRLFTNPFGILGHQICQTNVRGRNLTGVCFNEVECLVRGGSYSGYCSPSSLSGVCCAFVNTICDRTLNNKVSYFTNPGFPAFENEPRVCMQTLRVRKNTCWVRFDYENFELSAQSDGACIQDGLSIINSSDGPSGRLCGNKNGFSQIVRVDPDSSVELAMIVQSQRYRWNIKITQVPCSLVSELIQAENCGQTGAEGFLKRKRALKRQRDHGLRSKPGKKSLFKSRKRFSPRFSLADLYDKLTQTSSCSTSKGNNEKAKTRRSSSEPMENEQAEEALNPAGVGRVTERKLQEELFNPSFSARNVFCQSKFRNEKFLGPSSKIIDGTETPVHAFPWMVSLNYNGEHFCGGSLLNEDTVLTAAHCMDFGELPNFQSNLLVYLGEHDVSRSNETEFTTTRRVARVIVHHGYFVTPGSSGDIAILKLDRSVPFNRAIGPVCIPTDSSSSFEQMLGISAGWGITEDGTLSDVLRQVELNIIQNTTCQENYRALGVEVSPAMICTFKGPNGSESICSGDSGGPLMVRQDNKFILVGLASFSVSDCSAPFPAVFTRVTAYLDWVAVALST